jgi:hypothetical protein
MNWLHGLALIGVSMVSMIGESQACCAVAEAGRPVVNADQTVILWWDRPNQTQHFIRRASFKGGGDSVGFLVPSPTRPSLEKSGDDAFPYLADLTRPSSGGGGFAIGCAVAAPAPRSEVKVIEEKTVAGYDAVVLTAGSGEALLRWLNENGFAFRPETAAWAEPYVKNGWYISAMKISKETSRDPQAKLGVSALRISFKTDRPLFPYREPDSRDDASKLDVTRRLLRIYLVAEAPYQGRFSTGMPWPANVGYSSPLKDDERSRLAELLELPATTSSGKMWLTEFEHQWPYGIAPGDVYFEQASKPVQVQQSGMDPTMILLAGGVLFPRLRRVVSRVVRSFAARSPMR